MKQMIFKKENANDIQLLFDSLSELGIEYIIEELYFAQCTASGVKSKTTSRKGKRISRGGPNWKTFSTGSGL